MRLLFVSITLLCFCVSNVNSQSYSQSDANKIQDLKSKIVDQKSSENTPEINGSFEAQSGKSPALAALFSLVLPGAGHFYLNRMDVGKYFLGIDAASWIGLASLEVYGNNVRDDSRKFSVEHAQVNDIDNKPDTYFGNIGSYANVYEYNNAMLVKGDYTSLYDANKFYWNWDSFNNQQIFETQRRNSERIYDSKVIFGSLLVANRIVSAISAYLIASSKPTKKTSLHLEPELLYKNNYSVDGIKINLSKNF